MSYNLHKYVLLSIFTLPSQQVNCYSWTCFGFLLFMWIFMCVKRYVFTLRFWNAWNWQALVTSTCIGSIVAERFTDYTPWKAIKIWLLTARAARNATKSIKFYLNATCRANEMGCVMGKRCTRELLDHILYYILFRNHSFRIMGDQIRSGVFKFNKTLW